MDQFKWSEFMNSIEGQLPKVCWCQMCVDETGKRQMKNLKELNEVKVYGQLQHELRMKEMFNTAWLCDRHFEEIK